MNSSRLLLKPGENKIIKKHHNCATIQANCIFEDLCQNAQEVEELGPILRKSPGPIVVKAARDIDQGEELLV